MAQVETAISARVEMLLDLVESAWAELPEIAAEIDGWEYGAQIDFTENWSIQNVRLNQIETHISEGIVSPEQLDRYYQLLDLIERNTPILDAIMTGPPTVVS